MEISNRLKRLINDFKTYKTFDLTRRVNNIIGLRHCRRSASLSANRFIKMSETSFPTLAPPELADQPA